MPFDEAVQFDILFYRFGVRTLPRRRKRHTYHQFNRLLHEMSACMRAQSRSAKDLLEFISTAWVKMFGDMKTLALDGEIGMRGTEADWATCSQITMNTKHHTKRRG